MENLKLHSVDLHMHSHYSDDGEFTPQQLVKKCKQADVDIMAISDHNCVKANKPAQEECCKYGIKYIPAIEIDCCFKNLDFHVLGYGIDFESSDFDKIEKNIMEHSKESSEKRLSLVQKLGFDITKEEIEAVLKDSYWKDVWTGEVIAEILLKKPEYIDNELLKPYRENGTRSDNPYVNFYWDYCSQGKPCYSEIEFPNMKEIIKIIHDNGGKAVLAHPGNNLAGRFEMFEEIVPLGIDGIEVFSSYHDKNVTDEFYEKAKKHNLLITCGSDYHGKIKPSINIGQYNCIISQEEIKNQLYEWNLI